jgi:hypothetical protein
MNPELEAVAYEFWDCSSSFACDVAGLCVFSLRKAEAKTVVMGYADQHRFGKGRSPAAGCVLVF